MTQLRAEIGHSGPVTITPGPFPAPKPRPSGWWFVVGVVLLLAAAATFVWFLFLAIDEFGDVEARVPADGAAHQVTVAPDEDKFLWVREYDVADCVISDQTRGVFVEVRPVSATYRRGGSSGWVADGRFDGGSGRLEVTCATSGGPAEIGPAVDVSSFVTSLLLAILLPLTLGFAGVIVLVVTGILWAVRPRRTT